ncbi:MAG: hypothetical protein P8Z79_20800 [Sedimentisphaerales bacterium]|jgi:hypothetical protein
MNDLWIALIGIFGVILGAGLNELLRRSRRIEQYTGQIFEKRLEKYERLMALLQTASEVATDVMKNTKYTYEQRHELISAVVLTIAEFGDDNELYIDQDLAAHCTATFMGAEDVLDVADPKEQEERRQEIRDMCSNARRMIREDSGIAQIDRLFKTMTKPRLSSPIIKRIQYLKAHPEEVRKLRTPEGQTPDEEMDNNN